MGNRRLVEPPGNDAPDAGAEHKEGVDAGPRPRSVDRGGMIVDFPGPNNAHDTVMNSDIQDRQAVRNPILVESQKNEHDKKVEVKLDVAAGKMHENRRRADQTKTDKGGSHGTASSLPARQERKDGDNQPLRHRVEHRAIAEWSREA